MAWISAWVMMKEAKKLEKLGIEITDLQKKALYERVVLLTAKAHAERETENLLQRLRPPEQNAEKPGCKGDKSGA
jgi:ribosomal 50S subunit-associated protein YjgA (DUF615 family)